MSWYGKAIKREIPPGANDPRIKPVGVILHVDAGNAGGEALYGYFKTRSGGIESHFHIQKDGKVYQYRDTHSEADANYKANSFVEGGIRKGYISVETQGLERGYWTSAQLQSIKELLLWARREHGIPLKKCANPTDAGIGYHTLFGAPSAWTPVSKSCPGPDRKRQFHETLVPWMAKQTGLTPRQRMRIRRLRRYIKLWQAKIVELTEREARLRKRIAEGTINVTKAENRIALIRRNIRTYRRKIAEYEARIRRIQN
jgi:hypothetical protein